MVHPTFQRNLGYAIDTMVATLQHIRDCERCNRLYATAVEASMEAKNEIDDEIYGKGKPRPAWAPLYKILEDCLRDLHQCENWPG